VVLRSVHAQAETAAIEVTATIVQAGRVRAVVARLEQFGGRWCCVEFGVLGPDNDGTASVSRCRPYAA
jgi:hypothetical protein